MKLCAVLMMMGVLFMGVCVAEEYTVETLKKAVEGAEGTAAVTAVCREYIEKSLEVKVVDPAFGLWHREDKAGLTAFLMSPDREKSSKYLSLKIRVTESAEEKLVLARKAVAVDPDSIFGKLAMGGLYSQHLFKADRYPESEDTLLFKTNFSRDEVYFQTILSKKTHDPMMLRYLAEFETYRKNYLSALDLWTKAEESDIASWVPPRERTLIYIQLDDMEKAEIQAGKYVDIMVEAGRITADEKDTETFKFVQAMLSKLKKYDRVLKRYTENPDALKDNGHLYNIACIYALKGDSDQAFAHLSKATAAGWDDADHMAKDSDFNSLHDDPRWEKAIASASEAWEKGKETRKKKIVASKFSKPAPLWELKDVSGNVVKLADLKGKIVILDFWATWCTPCMMAMPALDTWCKTKKPDNAKVFSINVWERDVKKAKALFQEKKYAMTLVFGEKDTAEKYGVKGIPYICAIDKEGNIRYEQLGYDKSLEEALSIWVVDLGK